MALKAIQVENAKPNTDENRDYRVADGHGLYLMVRPNGTKVWRFDYRLGSVRRTFSIGGYDRLGDGKNGFTLAQAREEHQKARAAVADGQHPISPKRRAAKASADKATSPTFGALADDWLIAREVGHSAKTYDRDQRSVRYLKEGYRGVEGFGHLPVDQVETKHLSAIAKKLNRPTRRRVVAAARKIMAKARVEGWLTHSPL
jgi:hypothetical protein